MHSQAQIRLNPKLAALLILLALPIFIGSPFCSKKDNPFIPPPPPPTRDSPEALLETFFPAAYETKDSTDYDKMLHAEFQFEFLQADADSLIARNILDPGQTFWGRTRDLQSTGAMFRHNNVGTISLEIFLVADPIPSSDCTGCMEVQTDVTLNVDTDLSEPEIRTLNVVSKQVFVVRPEEAPGDTSLWVIFRQFDRPRT